MYQKKVEKMQGKILGFDDLQGAILGDDGKRYHFDISEVKNAKNADLETLSGSEVDFELANGKAVEIYITKFQQNFKMPQKPEVKALKNKFYIALGILIGGTILIIFVVTIINIALEECLVGRIIVSLFFPLLYVIPFYNITKFVQEHSRSDTLMRRFVLYNAIPIICGLISFLVESGLISFLILVENGVLLIFILIVCVATLIIKYYYYKELAEITTQPLFMYAFWCNVSIILSPIGFILWIMAWVGVKKIRVYAKQ